MFRRQGQGEFYAFQGVCGLRVAKIGLGHVVVNVFILGAKLNGLEISLDGLLVLFFLAQPDAQCVVWIGRVDVVFDDFDEYFFDLGKIVELCVFICSFLQIVAVAVDVVFSQIGLGQPFVSLDEGLVAGQGLVEGLDGVGPFFVHQKLAAPEEKAAGLLVLLVDDEGQVADGVFIAALDDQRFGLLHGLAVAVRCVFKLSGLDHVLFQGGQGVGAQNQPGAPGGDDAKHELFGPLRRDDQNVQVFRLPDFAQGSDKLGDAQILDFRVDDDDPGRIELDELHRRLARGKARAVAVSESGQIVPGFLKKGVLARGHENEIRHSHALTCPVFLHVLK